MLFTLASVDARGALGGGGGETKRDQNGGAAARSKTRQQAYRCRHLCAPDTIFITHVLLSVAPKP